MTDKEQLDRYLSQVNEYIGRGYDHFLKVARNIISKCKGQYINGWQREKNLKKGSNCYDDLHIEALNDTLVNFYDKIERDMRNGKDITYMDTEDDWRRYFTMYMHNWIKFNALKAPKDRKDNSLFTYRPYLLSEDLEDLASFDEKADSDDYTEQESISYDGVDDIYIQAELIDDNTKLYIRDMLSNGIPVDISIKLQKVDEIRSFLTPQEQVLFDLVFKQEMNSNEIHKELKALAPGVGQTMTLPTVRQKIRVMRDKVKIIVDYIKYDD